MKEVVGIVHEDGNGICSSLGGRQSAVRAAAERRSCILADTSHVASGKSLGRTAGCRSRRWCNQDKSMEWNQQLHTTRKNLTNFSRGDRVIPQSLTNTVRHVCPSSLVAGMVDDAGRGKPHYAVAGRGIPDWSHAAAGS